MRYQLLSDIGGFTYWVLIKFCKSDLEQELAKDKWARNILIFTILFSFIMYLSVNYQ